MSFGIKRRTAALTTALAIVSASLVLWAPASHAGTVSAPPRLPIGVAFDRSVTLHWLVPTTSGGSSIDQYRVRVVENGRQLTVPAAPLQASIGNLVDGTAYTFTVAAHNAAGWSAESAPSAKVYPTRPNIVLLLTDDQRWDSMNQLPATNARLWRRYTQSFVDEPQCCPSRSSTFTGRYPNHTGVETLVSGANLNEHTTFATLLHAAGYQTMFAGKYLNGYPFNRGPYVPPGWDKFYGFSGSAGYYDYQLVQNGTYRSYAHAPADYSTDVLRGKIIAASRAASPARPVLLEFAPNAPHRAADGDPTPAPRHVGVCANRAFPFPPNFNAHDSVSEPPWMAGETSRSTALMKDWRRATCETLRGVDEAVTAIINELATEQRLANTYIVLTSDNGYQFGEHRLFEKGDLYDEAIRVPLLVRGPGVTYGPESRLTSNVDLAPTFLEWARVAPPSGFFDGTSFAGSAAGLPVPGPDAVLLHGCRTSPVARGGSGACGGYPTNMGLNWGVRTARYAYIEYPDGYRQLFDVVADPYELKNLAPNSAYTTTMTTLHDRLVAFRGTTAPAPVPPAFVAPLVDPMG